MPPVIRLVTCGFCGQNHRKSRARWFIAGRGKHAICSDCVEVCNEIIAENDAEANAAKAVDDAVADGNQGAMEPAVTPAASAAQKE